MKTTPVSEVFSDFSGTITYDGRMYISISDNNVYGDTNLFYVYVTLGNRIDYVTVFNFNTLELNYKKDNYPSMYKIESDQEVSYDNSFTLQHSYFSSVFNNTVYGYACDANNHKRVLQVVLNIDGTVTLNELRSNSDSNRNYLFNITPSANGSVLQWLFMSDNSYDDTSMTSRKNLVYIQSNNSASYITTATDYIFSPSGNIAVNKNSVYNNTFNVANKSYTIGDKILDFDEQLDILYFINETSFLCFNGSNKNIKVVILDLENNTYTSFNYTLDYPITQKSTVTTNRLNILNNQYSQLFIESKDILYSINSKDDILYNTYNSTAGSNDILVNRIAYNEDGEVIGSMPNNGELNYTPSTSEQTIPAGYTSGGTVAASPLTQDDYNSCLDLSYNILGIVYEEVELLHIGPDKTIDFGITVDLTNTYKLKFRDNTVDPYEAYIGVSVDKNTFLCRNGSSNGLVGNGMTKNLNTIPSTTPEEVIFNFSRAAGNTIWSGTTSGSSAINAEYDFYYLQVYSGDELINNFVPVREIATNKTGLLDKVTNTFIEY